MRCVVTAAHLHSYWLLVTDLKGKPSSALLSIMKDYRQVIHRMRDHLRSHVPGTVLCILKLTLQLHSGFGLVFTFNLCIFSYAK
jgi:hypothetical protein